jgi:hypothetical protein
MWHAHPFSLNKGIYELLLGYVHCVWKGGNSQGKIRVAQCKNGRKKHMQLDGKVFDVLLSITNNVVVLTNLKTMIMNFIGKTLNPTSIATPFNPKFALKQ